MYIGIIYLVLVNIISFSSMGYDKKCARLGRRRVPEKRLFLFSAIGGALGMLLGMKVWRHKTKHRSFTVGVPLLLVWNIVLVGGIIWLMAR